MNICIMSVNNNFNLLIEVFNSSIVNIRLFIFFLIQKLFMLLFLLGDREKIKIKT